MDRSYNIDGKGKRFFYRGVGQMQIEGYELVFEGTKRYYYEDFSCRDYSLDHCSPYLLKVGDVEFDSHAWVALIESVCHWFLSL